jgi:LuxR family maltose regulon positive regulatory protein
MAITIHGTVPLNQGDQFYLERPRIYRLLEKAMEHPVVIVTAGAGYGKTQAIYSYLRTCEAMTAWMQLSERDNFTDRFWENFVAAVSLFSKETARRLAEHGFPSTDRLFDRYLRIPQEEVIPGLRYFFVYDDFHLIQNKEVIRFMEHSITAPFPNIISIVISRTVLPMDITARNSRHTRALQSQAAQITEEELRFTEDETVEYFHRQGIKVGHQTIARICRDTEGWAFALHLSALFFKHLSVSSLMMEDHRLPGMRSNVFRLLETEVFDPVSPGLRKFLIKLSLIDFLPRELLEALNPQKDLIAEMEGIGSFIRHDSYTDNYHIHHLFLEFLANKQNELEEQEKKEIYHTAAQWCVNNDRRIDALTYYERAGDYQSIIDIIDRLPLILPNNTSAHLKELLSRIPPALYDDNPVLEALYGKICMSLGLFSECTTRLREHIKRLEDAIPPEWAALGPGQTCRALRDSYLLLGFVGLITSTDTEDYGYTEDLKKAAIYSSLSGQIPQLPATVLMLGSYVCRVRDGGEEKIASYLKALEDAVPYGVQAFGGCMYGMDELARGEYAYFRGDLPGAEAYIRRALQRSRERKQYEIENRSLFYLMRISIHRGNYQELKKILHDLEDQENQEYYRNRVVHLDIALGWFYVQIGEIERIASWLKNDFEESEINYRGRGQEILVKAKYHLYEKKYPAALASLTGRRDIEGGLLFGKLETLALEAVCCYGARDQEGALAALRSSYQLALSSGITLPLVELGRFTRSLVDWALKEGPSDIDREWLLDQRRNAAAYAKRLNGIAKAFLETGQPSVHPPGRSPVTAPRLPASKTILSGREQEVLFCLSRGLTRTEIAGTLSLSINTVKSIIRSIYNKLGAVNRSHAVQAAAEAGILTKDGQ